MALRIAEQLVAHAPADGAVCYVDERSFVVSGETAQTLRPGTLAVRHCVVLDDAWRVALRDEPLRAAVASLAIGIVSAAMTDASRPPDATVDAQVLAE